MSIRSSQQQRNHKVRDLANTYVIKPFPSIHVSIIHKSKGNVNKKNPMFLSFSHKEFATTMKLRRPNTSLWHLLYSQLLSSCNLLKSKSGNYTIKLRRPSQGTFFILNYYLYNNAKWTKQCQFVCEVNLYISLLWRLHKILLQKLFQKSEKENLHLLP